MDLLRIDGRACKRVKNQEAYMAAETMEGMLPWNGAQDNLIDRFDGRALLDFYQEPDKRARRQKTEDELEVEEVSTLKALDMKGPASCAVYA